MRDSSSPSSTVYIYCVCYIMSECKTMEIMWKITVIFSLCIGAASGSVCSSANRANNLAGCLTKVKEIMLDPDQFWFGTIFSTACPNGLGGGLSCFNPVTDGSGQNIATRVFPRGLDMSMLTGYLEVTFRTDKGQYSGCGNTVTVANDWVKELDAVALSDIVSPWYVRYIPELKWTSSPGEYYSLYVYDIGYLTTHALYVNIQGNDIASSSAIASYRGSLMFNNNKNPYIIMIFRQSGYIEPAAAMKWYNTTVTSKSVIPDFQSVLNMTGPIAVNWYIATGDVYAANVLYSSGRLSLCPTFIGYALDMMPRPFLPKPALLSVMVDVQFTTIDISFTACCQKSDYPGRTFTVNPIGNELLSTAETRSGMVQKITFTKSGPVSSAKVFTGEMYTLIGFDPDVPVAIAGTESRPLLHQMMVNIVIQDGVIVSGEEILPWNGPYPPNDVPHYYYGLLYKQHGTINATDMPTFAGHCSGNLVGRCLYDINTAVSANNLTLVGASWFRAVRDDYVIYRNIQRNPSTEEAQCHGQPNYHKGCSTASPQIVG